MKLKTNKCVALFLALQKLDGADKVVTMNGVPRVVQEPFEIHPKARWNAVINRNKLRPIVEAHEELVNGYKKELRAFRLKLDQAADPKENQRKLAAETERLEELMSVADRDEQNVEGLRQISVAQLNLHIAHIPVTVLEELLPLLDGDPDFAALEKQAIAAQ